MTEQPKPKRVQMSRQQPWRAENPDAVIVARPTQWGNPYIVTRISDNEWAVGFKTAGQVIYAGYETTERAAFEVMLDVYRKLVVRSLHPEELAGRDLACWCPLDRPCHADVLLKLANPEGTA